MTSETPTTLWKTLRRQIDDDYSVGFLKGTAVWAMVFVVLLAALSLFTLFSTATPHGCEERILNPESAIMAQRTCPTGTRAEHVDDQWVCRCPVEVTP